MTGALPKHACRVLIVDQDVDVRVGLGLMLLSVGYQVEHASHGTEAILRHQHKAFHVIVTEVMMPEVDGLELMLALTREAPAPKFVFLSRKSRVPVEVFQRIIHRLGARHVLPKPFPPERLLAAVEQVLGES